MDPQVTKMCHSFVRNRKKVDKTQEPFQPPAIEDGHEFLLQLTADNCHFPSPSLANFLKMKCGHELDQKDLEAAATSLLHSQALAFRLLAYFNASKKVRKQDATAKTVSKPSSDSSGDMFADEDERTAEQIQKQILSFQSMSGKDGHVQRLIETLPAEWRVVQITADPHRRAKFKNARAEEAITDANFDLVVTSFQCGSFTHSLNMEKVQAVERGDRPTIMKEFFDMLLTHRKIYQKTKDFDRAAYNLTKDELEDRMKSLLDTIENKWLGYAKVFLLGRPKDQERVKRVEEAIEKLRKQQKLGQLDRGSLRTGFLFSIFDGASSLNKEQLLMAFQRITDKKSKLNEMVRAASEFGDNNPSLDNTDRHPVSLILDRDIQSLPWETLPIMRDQACARVPSIFFLCALYETHEKSKSSVTKMGVRNDKIFYVLNPNNDLKKTQERLEPKFKDLSLGEGVVGTWPSNPQFQNILTEMDAFMYCGHGVQLKTITAQEIEKLSVRAIPLLFGCNSGKIERLGRSFDPTGTANSYQIASSPCMLGFLWSITDLDLDTWTVSFLQFWLDRQPPDGERDFVRAVAKKRHEFQQILNGAATVVYGLPSFFEN